MRSSGGGRCRSQRCHRHRTAPDGVLRRPHRLRRHARFPRPPGPRRGGAAHVFLGRRGAAVGDRPALREAVRRPIVDASARRDAPCLSVQPARRIRTAPPASGRGYEIELRGEGGRAVADGEIGDLTSGGRRGADVWGNREKSRETFQGGWTAAATVRARRRRLIHLLRPQRRHAQVSGIWSRRSSGGDADAASGVLECASSAPRTAKPDQDQAFVVVKPGQR